MDKYNFKWDLSVEEFNELKKAIKAQSDTKGFYGRVCIGKYCIEINFDLSYVNLEFYHLGIDSGYGYTKEKHTPYDYEEGTCFEADEVLNLSFNDFKQEAEQRIVGEFLLGAKRNAANYLKEEVLCNLADWS